MSRKAPRERSGKYVPQSGAGSRVKEASTVRKDSMPKKKGC